MNLLEEHWIPVQRAGGQRLWIAPWQLTDGLADDPIVSLTYLRPDLNGSMAQFLIGLLQTVTPELAHEDAWEQLFETPPTPDTLREWCEPWTTAFELDGDGPRFMQDIDTDLCSGEPEHIAALLMDSPGGNALRLNTDHFVKRGEVKQLSPALAATALFSLQTNAPAGGQGNRTSLRGGGPLTTLVTMDPRQENSGLWHSLWLNVLDWAQLDQSYDCRQPHEPGPDIFPWLAKTRTSNPKAGGLDTTLSDVHPLQMYWSMPRRIRLDFCRLAEGDCDLGGPKGDSQLVGYHTRNYGVNYDGPWRHPLSPHYFDKQGAPLPLHARPGGLQYRHWLGLVQASGQERAPARVVSAFFEDRSGFSQQFCLWAFGYDMDKMKARAWYEARLPLYPLRDKEQRKRFESTVEKLVEAAAEVRGYLNSALRQAWFRRPKDAKGDMGAIDLAYWRRTEPGFYQRLDQLASAIKTGEVGVSAREKIREEWHKDLCSGARALFDQWATAGDISFEDPKRIANAHTTLMRKLYGKRLRTLLDISKPTQRKQGGSKNEAAQILARG